MCLEMVRHVLEGEWLYMQMLRRGGSLDSDASPFNPRAYTDVAAELALAEDLLAIPVPGHTAGSAVLLYKETFLFTGDHLMASEDDGLLHASRDVCWYSWPEQIRSMERLLDFRFDWVLPGHGGSYRASSASAMKNELERVVAEMKS